MSALLCRNAEGGATRPDITTTAGVFRGTNGSNPASSSGESIANLTFGDSSLTKTCLF